MITILSHILPAITLFAAFLLLPASAVATLPRSSTQQNSSTVQKGSPLQNGSTAQEGRTLQALPFKGGESLSYAITYQWGAVNTEVGSAELILNYSNGIFNPVVTGKSTKFWDRFYKVRELFESTFREKDGRPLTFRRDTREGKYFVENNITFNNKDYSIECKVVRKGTPLPDTTLQGTAETYDLLSLFYKVRGLDFSKVEIDKPQPISFVIDREIYNLHYIYHGPEVKKIKGVGKFNVLKFSLMVVTGEVFSGKDYITLYVTDDSNHIPLLFESPILVGKVVGVITKWDGLKYNLTSQIK